MLPQQKYQTYQLLHLHQSRQCFYLKSNVNTRVCTQHRDHETTGPHKRPLADICNTAVKHTHTHTHDNILNTSKKDIYLYIWCTVLTVQLTPAENSAAWLSWYSSMLRNLTETSHLSTETARFTQTLTTLKGAKCEMERGGGALTILPGATVVVRLLWRLLQVHACVRI